MNFKASSKFTPVDISRVMQRIVPPMVSAVTEGCAAVVDEAQMIAPVDKGDLVASIHTQSVAIEGAMVTGGGEEEEEGEEEGLAAHPELELPCAGAVPLHVSPLMT